MKITGNTILITGGGAGIGLALTKRFLKEKNTVIICGRNEQKLNEVKAQYPEVYTLVCDLANEKDRIALYEKVVKQFPEVNVLLNNAGIQQRFNLSKSQESWSYYQQEIDTNLSAPIHLISLFIPHLAKQKDAAILNVSSGLAFAPMAAAPVYCATKAAMHSFTMSLRYQLALSHIEVIEIVPPAVSTNLGGAGLHIVDVTPGMFADGVFEGLVKGEAEIGFGTSLRAMHLSRDEADVTIKMLNERIPY
jgi:uncharacterized oxidoreductase